MRNSSRLVRRAEALSLRISLSLKWENANSMFEFFAGILNFYIIRYKHNFQDRIKHLSRWLNQTGYNMTKTFNTFSFVTLGIFYPKKKKTLGIRSNPYQKILWSTSGSHPDYFIIRISLIRCLFVNTFIFYF